MSASMLFLARWFPLALVLALAGCAPASFSAQATPPSTSTAPPDGEALRWGDGGAAEGGDGAVLASAVGEVPTDEGMADDKDEPDDGAETPMALEGQTIKHPLDGWTKQQIEAELTKNPVGLGSMSIG